MRSSRAVGARYIGVTCPPTRMNRPDDKEVDFHSLFVLSKFALFEMESLCNEVCRNQGGVSFPPQRCSSA